MVNEKPKERFKFVKVKSLNELNSYLSFFEPIFDDYEVNGISDYLKEIRRDLGDIPKPKSDRMKKPESKTSLVNYGLRAWLKKNPGKGINDYYQENRNCSNL